MIGPHPKKGHDYLTNQANPKERENQVDQK